MDENELLVVAALCGLVYFCEQSGLWGYQILGRCANKCRNRTAALTKVLSWDDEMFHRQMRLCKTDFYDILAKVEPKIIKNREMARRSSKEAIQPFIKLVITLRVLAGAKYLDMVHFEVAVDHVMELVYETCEAIVSEVKNIYLPETEEGIQQLAHDWATIQNARYRYCIPMAGVILAGDGFIIKIK